MTPKTAALPRSLADAGAPEPIPPAPRRVAPQDLKSIIEQLRERHRKEAAEQIADVRRRIKIGLGRVSEAEQDGRDRKPMIRRLSELEGQLLNLERDYEVPILVMSVFADTFMGLENKVPEGSLVRIRMPGAIDVTIELAGSPL